ncbi:F-box/LRR-repeat protein At5g63520 isoform X1 [Cornus florida]|uniref:F-box/LRR-repeat protein At5g63520 isoform X1 n=1 Tax=Cornus florida TaxID=4283 RepID=UPI00289D7F9C|nr:F-box/LRR-repeat protein At5g63520 isoform X1 [Cornus florida]
MPRHREKQKERHGGRSGIDLIGEDLLQTVLSRLPALSFASAACVSRSWNTVCKRILSRPKLSSALSLNPSLQVAVKEVVDKVLSQPIRPHFAIACVGPSFNLRLTHNLITKKLGFIAPVITCEFNGIMGREALTNEFKEIQWGITDDEDNDVPDAHGIILTIGFLPGLKVDVIPLVRSIEEPQVALVDKLGMEGLIDKWVMDIREYTASVSGGTSPAGIIMFGGLRIDMKTILDKMDYAMSRETFIVGGESNKFLYRRNGDSSNANRRQKDNVVAVALLLATDRNKPLGIGDTQFRVAFSPGISPIGPMHKAVSVREKRSDCSTWLTARREGLHDVLDGQTMLNDINDEMGDRIEYPALYIGVTERRKCSIGLEKASWVTSLAFHEVMGGDEEYLFVNGCGIKTGDSFRFYQSDSSTAFSFCSNVSENLKLLKQDGNKEVFGGIIFSCCGRGNSFFRRSYVDSFPFLENFPGIPLGGAFCGGEIGRGSLSLYSQEAQQSSVRCCLHVYSTVYLAMSYTPVLPEC